MSEFIISSEQLERIIEYIEHDTGREINRLVIDGVRARELVRCRDCRHYREHKFFESTLGMGLGTDINDVCMFFSSGVKVEPDGFCSWAERREQ